MSHPFDVVFDHTYDALRELRAVLPGQVALPGDDGWNETRLGWTRSVDQRPLAVVTARNEDDVVAAVSWARRHGLSVSTQPYGHGATTAVGGVVVLRTGALQRLEVDPVECTATVGAGVQWSALGVAAGAVGLSGLVGSSGEPSVVGYTLGGGMSWFGRRYGLAAHHVLSFDVVDSSGVRRQVTADSDPNLFWALRGGGGEFAVVLSMRMALHPVPHLSGGRMMWPAEMALPVLHAFRELTQAAPPELTAWAQLVQMPPVPEVPEAWRGRSFVTVNLAFVGVGEELAPLLQRLNALPDRWADTVGDVAVADIAGIANDPRTPTASTEDSWLLADLDDHALETVVALAGPRSGSRLVMMQLRHLGAGFKQATTADGPQGAITEPYQLFCMAVTPTAEGVVAARAELDVVAAAMTTHRTGRRAFNFISSAEPDPTSAFSTEVLQRLRAVKNTNDPGRVFTGNRPYQSTPVA